MLICITTDLVRSRGSSDPGTDSGKEYRYMSIVRKIVLVICLIVFVGSAGVLADYFINGIREQNALEGLKDLQTGREDLITDKGTVIGKYADLYLANSDIIGWIKIEDTRVDYPVMQTKDDPEFYLHRGFSKEYTGSGVPFMDAASDIFIPTSNFLIYGHHMKNGTMFADIRACRNEAFFRSHLTGYYTTPQRQYRLEFFAFLVVDASAPIFTVSFEDAAAREALLRYIDETAMYRTELAVTADAHLFSLSTCTYEFDDARAVLVGVVAP